MKCPFVTGVQSDCREALGTDLMSYALPQFPNGKGGLVPFGQKLLRVRPVPEESLLFPSLPIHPEVDGISDHHSVPLLL